VEGHLEVEDLAITFVEKLSNRKRIVDRESARIRNKVSGIEKIDGRAFSCSLRLSVV
jgi:hypothetical protein